MNVNLNNGFFKRLSPWIAYLIPLFFLTFAISDIPGPNGDEINFLSAPYIILSGEKPADIHFYTGRLYHYILFCMYTLFGDNLTVLRLFSVFMNVLCLFIGAKIIKELKPGDFNSTLFILILGTSPFFIAFSRYANESTTLNPLLMALGTWLYLKSLSCKGAKLYMTATLAGSAFAFGVFNHIIAVVFPLGVLLSLIIFFPKSVFKSAVSVTAGMSFILLLLIKFFTLFTDQETFGTANLYLNAKPVTLSSIIDIFYIIFRLFDGYYVYERFVGFSMITVIPYGSMIFFMIFFIRFFLQRGEGDLKRDYSLLTSLLFVVLFTIIIIPNFSLRFYLLALCMIPFIIVILHASIRSRILKKISLTLISILILGNITYVTVNYFISFSKTGGKPNVFKLGNFLIETSNHFLETRTIYNQLKSNHIDTLYTDIFLSRPLNYYDREERRFKIITANLDEIEEMDKDTAILFYSNSGIEMDTIDIKKRTLGGVELFRFKKQDGYDRRFIVYVYEERNDTEG